MEGDDKENGVMLKGDDEENPMFLACSRNEEITNAFGWKHGVVDQMWHMQSPHKSTQNSIALGVANESNN